MEAKIIDVREYPEYAAGHVEGSELVPLGTLEKASEGWNRSQVLQVLCRTGRRAAQAKEILDSKGFQSVEVLMGGIEAWQQAGKPVTAPAAHKPWAMERQVRVTAGSLVVGCTVAGMLTSKRFFLGAGLIGAGLVYAGVSYTCMMASVLGRMPWNRPESAQA